MNRSDPYPRDARDLSMETTAAFETLQTVLFAMAMQMDRTQLERLLTDFEQGAEILRARLHGESHPDRYLDFVEEHLARRRAGIQALVRTSE